MSQELINLLFETIKLVFNVACLWAAWYAGKEGWFENQNKWVCQYPKCRFVAKSNMAWVTDRLRSDHIIYHAQQEAAKNEGTT